MIYALAISLTVLNLLLWFSILFNLPGAWLMILIAIVVEWWQPEEVVFGYAVLFTAVGLATLGEVLEFALGAAGSRRQGGSRRGAALAIAGAIVGAVLGTALPIPILGTLIGACVGAFAGSLLGDVWAGHQLPDSIEAGRGAAVGRFWGTIAKMIIGGAIVVLLGVAPFM